jgi:hypothetical protein
VLNRLIRLQFFLEFFFQRKNKLKGNLFAQKYFKENQSNQEVIKFGNVKNQKVITLQILIFLKRKKKSSTLKKNFIEIVEIIKKPINLNLNYSETRL